MKDMMLNSTDSHFKNYVECPSCGWLIDDMYDRPFIRCPKCWYLVCVQCEG